MNVNGVGGAAALPMTLASSSQVVPSAVVGSITTASEVTSTTGSGDARFPGQPKQAESSAAKTAGQPKDAPKPAPLPPLRGLTVTEIRAMLGMAPLSGQRDAAASAAPRATSITSTALNRYS